MIDPRLLPPPPRGAGKPSRATGWPTAGWPTALIHGLLAFGVMAMLGQVASFAAYAVGQGGGLPLSTFVRIGWLYFGAFHDVPLSVDVSHLDLGGLSRTMGGSALPVDMAVAYRLGFAPLLITAVAVWLLFRGGREIADRAGGGPVARALHGLKIAPVYAVPAFLLSLLVSVRVPIPLVPLMSGELRFRLSIGASFAFPFLIAAIAGVGGGLRSARENVDDARLVRLWGALSGGVWMLIVAMALSYLGLFIAGAVQPDAPIAFATPSTAKYYETVFERPDVGAVLFAHHVAVAPDEAMWVLVPAMGGCDGAYGDVSHAFLCYDKYPLTISLPDIDTLDASGDTSGRLGPRVSFGAVPISYYLFSLAPALAVLSGGLRAARRGRARTSSEAAALGGAAGAVFALLVVGVGYLSTITAGYATDYGLFERAGSVRLGPDLVSGGLLALAWGVVGGMLGGSLGPRGHRRG